MVRISLVPALTPLHLYVSTFQSTCAVPNMAVFRSSLTSWFPGMLLTYFLNDSEMVPVAPIITGINFVFTFHIRGIHIQYAYNDVCIMSRELNLSTQSSRASSRTIYTWQRTTAQRDTSLLLLWRRSDGQEQSVSSSGTLRTSTKISSSRTRNFSPSRSSIITRTRFMLKRSVRCVMREYYYILHWHLKNKPFNYLKPSG